MIIPAETPLEHVRNVLMILVNLPTSGDQVDMTEADRAAMMERLERVVQQLKGGDCGQQADQLAVRKAGPLV